MNSYVKELAVRVGERYGEIGAAALVERLFESGVIDYTLCKVLAVREWVWQRVEGGAKKTDAMWEAAEHFSCSYEYVRKCIYYYKDVNLR